MNEPKLRFHEFRGKWKKQLFGDIFTEENQRTNDKQKYPLYSMTIENGVIPKTDRYEREFLITKDIENYKVANPKSFVYNPMNLRFGALAINKEPFPVSVSGYYNVFKINNNTTTFFWLNYLTTKKMLNYYNTIAIGSLVEKKRVHFSQFINISKPVPDVKEQAQISDFFYFIDKKLNNAQAKVAHIEKIKKGLMQKIFSQEIRFKDDSGNEYPEWEEKRLDSIGKFIQGSNLSKDDISQNGEPCILYGELFTTYKETITSIQSHTKVKGSIYGEINDLLFPSSTTVDAISLICPSSLKVSSVLVGGDIIIFRPNKEICSDFLSYQINYYKKKEFAKLAQGSTIIHIHKKDLAQEYVYLPSLSEQQRIADFISIFDKKIEVEKEMLEHWKNIKKGLLQQMFI